MDAQQEQTRKAIQALLDQTGMTPSELARRAGLAPSTLTRFLAGAQSHMLSARTLGKLAALTGSTLAVSPAGPTTAPAGPPARTEMPRDVPVLGTAMGANGDGAFVLNQSGEVDRVRRGPGIAQNRKVFAIYVEGDSMAPRFEPGELIYLDPTRPARSGDDVVIVTEGPGPGHAPRAYLKRLRLRGGERIIAEQFNPPKDIEIDAKLVRQVIRVLRLHEVMGTG